MTADTVFVNGQVVTVDAENRICEAVAVRNGWIVAVGTNDEVKSMIGDSTKIVDLGGMTLVPGFIDAHMHITLYGTNKLGVSCKAPHIESLSDILTDLKEKVEQTPKEQWVRAWGFNDTKVVEQRFLTKEELDEVSKEHPILVARACGHISMANSQALELAGIKESSPDPQGGKIGRDESGVTTGVLFEAAHMNIFEVAKFTDEEMSEALASASEDLVSAGITSVHDAGGYGADNLRVMQEAVRAGEVKTRIYAMICALNKSQEFVEDFLKCGVVTGLGDKKFMVGPAKVFTDGSSSGPTVGTREAYTSDPNDFGILYYSQEELNDILGRAHEKGFQITAHAQGDRAIEMTLDCIEFALEKHPREDHRHRIEHAGLTMPDLLERMKNMGVIPIPNPAFFHEFGDGYIKNYGDRVKHMYPARDFIDAEMIVAAGSDSPVTSYDPLLGIHVAVNRKSQSGKDIGPNQRVSVTEAIRLFTWNGAYASFEEDIKGSVEPGKLADLVVLSEEILSVPEEQIKDVEIELTMIDGEVVFQRDTAAV